MIAPFSLHLLTSPGTRCPWAWLAAALLLVALPVRASDHADPIHLPQGMEFFDDGKPNAAATARAAGNTTDLFVFPLKEDGTLADFPLKEGEDSVHAVDPAELAQIKSLAVILCVRPGLRKAPPLDLSAYTYSIHMDLHSPLTFDKKSEVARYGGSIPEPEKIEPDVTIELQLNDDTTLKKQTITSPSRLFRNFDKVHVYNAASLKQKADEIRQNPNDIHLYTGYQDDPFIFPRFFGSNIVSMVMIIPLSCFPDGQRNWLAWANTRKGNQQFDHVGRSLRTQNPRFELLNPLAPKDHVAAIKKEIDNPNLMRDLFVKLGFDNLFEYRPWDLAPDVMVYSDQFNVGFPNGRRLTDDVAALLARNGDTLLLELSYKNATWPRATTNDKPFLDQFPFLADPWPDSMPKPGPVLSSHNQIVIKTALAVAIILAVLGLWKLIELLVRFVRLFFNRPIKA
ncbi:MAG: hypothetical protein QOE34_2174 [Verrucomicrobiota bacterium]|jgi:hypothetical protein